MSKQYEDEQYNEMPDYELDTGFTNYKRLLVELNDVQYFPNDQYEGQTYKKILNENGLDPEEIYNKNTDHAQLLETVYTILQTLYNNIDLFRKIETEFVTQSEAATALSVRLKSLRTEINRVKAEMNYNDSDFSFMYFTR